MNIRNYKVCMQMKIVFLSFLSCISFHIYYILLYYIHFFSPDTVCMSSVYIPQHHEELSLSFERFLNSVDRHSMCIFCVLFNFSLKLIFFCVSCFLAFSEFFAFFVNMCTWLTFCWFFLLGCYCQYVKCSFFLSF